jgi:hypothetical protein
MSQRSIDLCNNLMKASFVPVQQELVPVRENQRIPKLITPKFAIVSNGGTIQQMKPDIEWSNLISEDCHQHHFKRIIKDILENHYESWVERDFYIDNFLYVP